MKIIFTLKITSNPINISMDEWRIYYSNGSVITGYNQEDWIAAPDYGVQVIVRFPMLDPLGWTSQGIPIRDRDLWTGTDDYDPFGFGVKYGSLMDTDEYFAIWDKACTERPL